MTTFAGWWIARRRRAPAEAPHPGPAEPQVDLHLRVQVVDRRERPLAGATVRAVTWGGAWAEETPRSFGPVETDPEGRASLLLSDPGSARVTVEHPEWGVRAVTMFVPGPPQTVFLPGGVTVAGRVLTPAGSLASVESGRLEPASGDHDLERALSFEAPGVWRLGGVTPGAYLLYLEGLAEPQPLVVPPVLATAIFRHDLVWPELIDVPGRAADPDGRPLPGWRIGAFPEGGEQLSSEVETDPDGGFELRLTRGRRYHFRLVDPDFAQPHTQVTAEADGAFLHLTGPKTAHLSGRVVLADPRCAGPIIAHVGSRTYLVPSGGATFQLDGLPAGRQGVWLESEHGISRPIELDLAGPTDGPFTFTLEPKVNFRGRILDADGRPRPERHQLVLRPEGLSAPQHALALGPDGTFVLEGLAPGPYLYSVRGPGWLPSPERTIALGRADLPRVWTVANGAPLTGILQHHGVPLAGVPLFLRPLEPHPWGHEAHAETDAAGRFRFDGAPPGRYALLHYDAEQGHGRGAIVDVPSAGLFGIAVELEPEHGARMALHLPTAPGRRFLLCVTPGRGTVPGAAPAIRTQQVEPLVSAVVLLGLPPGPATLSVEAFEASDAAGQSWSLPVDLVPQEVTRVQLPPLG